MHECVQIQMTCYEHHHMYRINYLYTWHHTKFVHQVQLLKVCIAKIVCNFTRQKFIVCASCILYNYM